MKLTSAFHGFTESYNVDIGSGVSANVFLVFDQDGDLIEETYTRTDGQNVTDELKNELFDFIEANKDNEIE